VQWTIQDLSFLHEAGVAIDRQTLDEVLEYENRNYSLFDCTVCGTPALGQHANFCERAAILWELDWHRRIVEEDWPVKRTQ